MAFPRWLAGIFPMAAGCAWLLGGDSLLGPLCSVGLPLVMMFMPGHKARLLVALGYYLIGGWPIVEAVTGYWGTGHWWEGMGAWMLAAMLLSFPWAWAETPGRIITTILVTALPPIGVIGWLSPLNAAGVLFPGSNWVGLLLLLISIPVIDYPGQLGKYGGSALILVATVLNLSYREALTPPGWVGVQTTIRPGNGNVLKGVENNRTVVEAGRRAGAGAKVVVFPEAILDNWYPGTQHQLSSAIPAGQVWLVGAESKNTGSDGVMVAQHGHSIPEPVAKAAGLLLGGDWLPWKKDSLHPAWWQSVFTVDGERVWASLCVEQVQPWTWLEAMAQRPDLIIAMTNDWWAQSMAAPEIQMASTRTWARLMRLPLVVAVNQP
ncbi:MAG: conjugal transfer protein TraB [Ferrovum sp.]|nr:conjugal transfer protein TraB [Ferrovum sp.]NDU89856.1 conjugal transfer protein TraB [Ferrovum sp.]